MALEPLFDGWEDQATDEDFFSAIDSDPKGEDSEPIISRSDQEEEDDTLSQLEQDDDKGVSEDIETEEDLFESVESEEDDDTADQKESSGILSFLKKSGYIEEDDEELPEDYDEEEYATDKIEEYVDSEIKRRLEEFPEDAKAVVKYLLDGGDLGEFARSYGSISDTSIPDSIDYDDEKSVAKSLENLLKEEGEDPEVIKAQIEFLKDSGNLENFTKRKHRRWKEQKKLRKEEILKSQRRIREEERAREAQSIKRYRDLVSDEETLSEFSASGYSLRNLPEYINAKSVTLSNGVKISEMQKELFYELPKNEVAMLQLGVLLKSRNKDGTFNFDVLNRNVKSRKKSSRKSSRTKPKPAQRRVNRSLADYF